jgi:ATP-dependent helicase/nuclease subunit A
MNKAILNDQEARDKIKAALDQTFLVEAGAGSGKTAGLVDRMVALLAEGKCDPEKMAAVTFTRKAAGELKERFQVGLERRLRKENDPQVKERLAEALEKIERIFTGTIHAFCARLLRERPIEAGIAPDFTEIEGLEERLLEETAWEQYLVEVGAKNPALLDQLVELDLSHLDLHEAFIRLNLYPDVTIIKKQIAKPDLAEARKELDHFLNKSQPLLPADEPDRGWDPLQGVVRTALRWKSLFNLQDDRIFLRLLARLDRSASATYNRWDQDKDEIKSLEQAFNNFRENLVKPALTAWFTYRHYHLINFIEPAVKQYREMRSRENLLNFQDLLMLTAKLLRENSEVRGYFQERYTHLLVDEFQDTDPIQAEIMFYLTGEDLTEMDWAKLKPKPGSLFVVGDPKQSIYRFRRADISTYDHVKQLIEASEGEILILSTNFRSLPNLIDWGNTAFNELFSPIVPPYQADFTAMDDFRVNRQNCAEGLLTFKVEAVSRHTQEEIARKDAEEVAKWIELAINGGIRLCRSDDEEKRGLDERAVAGDFLIIVSKKKNMTLYARALEQRGIAFSLSGGGDLAESTELKELLNLLRTLADPDNPVPLVATLRGLFFGISDDLLYRFKLAGGKFNFLTPVPEGADKDILKRFNSARETFMRYKVWVKNLPPSSAIEKIIDELGLIPYALAGEMGRGRAGSIMQALEFLRSRESRGECSFGGAIDFLERLLEEGVEEELAVDGGSTSAVRIINLHKAKGLEAPVVILANPGNHKVYDPDLHVARTAQSAEGYLVIDKTKDDYGNRETLALPPEWGSKGPEEEKYRDAEYIRLLYVAATRAKNVLVISTYEGKPENSPWHPLESFLNEQNSMDAFSVLQPVAAAAAEGLPEQEIEPINAELMQAAAGEICTGLKDIAEPSYRHISGAQMHSGTALPLREGWGKGTAWGTAVHEALEILVRENIINGGKDMQPGLGRIGVQHAVSKAAAKTALSGEQQKELIESLKQVLASAFWQRITEADEVMAEVPFGSWVDNTYSTGIVDLAVRENGGWVLVDYKSDSIENDLHQQNLIEHYRPQLELYRKCWEKITGEKVIECGLFFTDKCYHILKFNIPESIKYDICVGSSLFAA